MYAETTMVLAIMTAAFFLSSWKFKSPEIALLITAVAGAVAGGLGFPARLLVEGTFTYFDVGLIFLTASIFINFYSETGAMNALVRKIVDRFYARKWVMFTILTVIMLIPGALTGAGSVSMFVVGGMVATVLRFMGICNKKTVAFIYITSMLAAVAPPINLWVMMMAAQANMPYVGFELPLIAPVVLISAFAIVYLLRGGTPDPKEKILAELPQPPAGMNTFRIVTPLLVFITLIIAAKYAAFAVPTLGIPLIFIICALLSVAVDPEKKSFRCWYLVLNRTMEQVFPLLATVICVGVLVNIMAATGVRGLIAITFVTLPVYLIFASALVVLPLAQATLSYSSAIIIGAPLIFLFNSIGVNVTIVAAALSFIYPLGDSLPPARVSGRVAIDVTGYQGSYMSFMREIWVPSLFMGLVGLGMLIFANKLTWLIV